MLMDCTKTFLMSKRQVEIYNEQFFGNDEEFEDETTYCEQCCENHAEITEIKTGLITSDSWEINLCFHCRNNEIKTGYNGVKDYRDYNRIVGVKLFKN